MARDFQRPFLLPDGATEVMLVRHGSSARSTPEAPIALVDGRSDPPLSDFGRRQAEAVGERLARSRIDGLFVTPLQRTHQTAAPLAGRLGLQPTVIPELREVFLGDWEGQLNARVIGDAELAEQVFTAQRWDVIPGAEPMGEFTERVRRGLERLAEAVGPDAIAVAVVHGGVIAEACRQVTNSEAFAFLAAENGSVTRIMRLAARRWALISFNETAHLDAGVNG
jgi:probable phosphoglycerate mutase